MFLRVLSFICHLNLIAAIAAPAGGGSTTFVFNGFLGANLSLNGIAEITSDGLLMLTNNTKGSLGHAFSPLPLAFTARKQHLSFSTTFVFAILPEYPDMNGHGLALVLSPSKELPGAMPQQNLGLFNTSDNINKSSNHIIAVELDTVKDSAVSDINDNHIGIDVNGLRSVNSSPVAYFDSEDKTNKSLKLISGQAMQLWVDYNGRSKQLDVKVAPLHKLKPTTILVSAKIDISQIVLDEMYVGFSASTGAATETHYILGWSFSLGNGDAPALDLSKLPHLPPKKRTEDEKQKKLLVLSLALPFAAVIALLISASLLVFLMRRRRKYAEVIEDWEKDLGPLRFSYKDLYEATKGFKEENLLGAGGFGKVYRGKLLKSVENATEIAVKKISHDSRQGVKEFVSEVVSMGRLRHRNLVQLLGYCRRQGELLLVYDYMPNSSLDKYLFDGRNQLSWSRRFRIIKGVAAGLLYLHEGWEQMVIHRDIKASNVLLDEEFNAKLGDFGLARLYDHGTTDPQTTRIVGTLGYIAPEVSKTGKATTHSDVYAFGAFLLEVACGRRPMEVDAQTVVTQSLTDLVLECWNKGMILDAKDPKLGCSYDPEEMELVLKLGSLCLHPDQVSRPSMRQVVQVLEGDARLPATSPRGLIISASRTRYNESFSDFLASIPSTTEDSTILTRSPSSPFFSGNS